MKYEQEFNFGTEIISRDISKIISLSLDVVKNIIEKNSNLHEVSESELLEKIILIINNIEKLKKKLIYNIAESRVNEISNLLYYKNINIEKFLNKVEVIFLEVNDHKHLQCFKETYDHYFAHHNKFKIIFSKKPDDEVAIEMANKIVQFGWKTEAIPIAKPRKSLITRIFQEIFH